MHVFVDYDGTITSDDTFDVLVRRFAGDEAWRAADRDLASGVVSLRETLQRQAAHVRGSLEAVAEFLDDAVAFDPTFAPFVRACERRGIPVTVVSSGIRPIIERRLCNEGLGHIPVIANDVDDGPSWSIRFRDDVPNGTDKAALVRAAHERGARTVFIGDGRSDYDAALAADDRFAKRGRALERFLTDQRVPFVAFDDFAEVGVALEAAA